ncbi:hypothetical protein M3084_08535 [Succinatimonas hippei]|uniref:hypothetical protein n=1 Tax=Succinatimonas hippei TaxID=626938 RepID=UPI0020138C6F|nr:hypothetical protein [Succinatimonas hippei]MCL1603893.1 hypothetical protein [Succinatimonas hippei]
MEASKYILDNLQPGETLIKVFASSRGFFGSDVALTDKRVFGRMNIDGTSKGYSFPAEKIKGFEIKASKSLLLTIIGRRRVVIIGPYNHQLVFSSKTPIEDRDFIIETLNLEL